MGKKRKRGELEVIKNINIIHISQIYGILIFNSIILNPLIKMIMNMKTRKSMSFKGEIG